MRYRKDKPPSLSASILKSTKLGDPLSSYAPQQHRYAMPSPPQLPAPSSLLQNPKSPILFGLYHRPLFVLHLRLFHRFRCYLTMNNPISHQFLHNLRESRNFARKKCIAPHVGRLAPISLAVANVEKRGARDPAGW